MGNMSLKEKLEQLRQQQREAEEDGRRRVRAAEIKKQTEWTQHEALMDKITILAEEQLKPIFEELNTEELNGRGVIVLKKNEDVVAVEIFWDQKSSPLGDNYIINTGNGIRIKLGNNFLLSVEGFCHLMPQEIYSGESRTSFFSRPELARKPGTGGGRGQGSYIPGPEVPNSRPSINDQDWRERIEKDIVKILENGGERYRQIECKFERPAMSSG